MKRALGVALLAAGMASTASAQPVYRCGPDGRVYSQTPCRDGRLIDASDRRSPEQQAAAEEALRATRERGEAMERERHADEDRHRAPSRAAGIDGRTRREPDGEAHQPRARASRHDARRHAQPHEFRAIAPVRPTPRRANVSSD